MNPGPRRVRTSTLKQQGVNKRECARELSNPRASVIDKLKPSLRINELRNYATVAFLWNKERKGRNLLWANYWFKLDGRRRNLDISEKEEREALLLRKKSVTTNLPVFRDSVQFHF